MSTHTTEEVIEYIEEKELKANTQMLEIIGSSVFLLLSTFHPYQI